MTNYSDHLWPSSPDCFIWTVLEKVQIVLCTLDDCDLSSPGSNPYHSALRPASTITFLLLLLLPQFHRRCLLSPLFYLWQDCSRYHVQTLSRNHSFFTFCSANAFIFINVHQSDGCASCQGEEMHNEVFCFNRKHHICYPPLWRMEVIWRCVEKILAHK